MFIVFFDALSVRKRLGLNLCALLADRAHRFFARIAHWLFAAVSVSDHVLQGVRVRAKDSRWRPMDANANQIGLSRLCQGRDGLESRPDGHLLS